MVSRLLNPRHSEADFSGLVELGDTQTDWCAKRKTELGIPAQDVLSMCQWRESRTEGSKIQIRSYSEPRQLATGFAHVVLLRHCGKVNVENYLVLLRGEIKTMSRVSNWLWAQMVYLGQR